MTLSLLNPVSPDIKQQIASTFFIATYKASEISIWEDFFDYYERELKSLSLGVFSPKKIIPRLAAQSHEDIIYICGVLSASRDLKKCEIREKVRARFPGADDTGIERSLDLTVRLWLMLNVCDEKSTRVSSKASMRWNASCQLNDVISSQFQPSTLHLKSREKRISPSFTASNMVRVCGLRLQWTDSLDDHLRLDRRRKELWIFPYKDFLLRHLHATNEAVERYATHPGLSNFFRSGKLTAE